MRSVIYFLLMAMVVMLDFRLMNAMQVHEDATIVLRQTGCPVRLAEGDVCRIQGDLRRTFAHNDIEIRQGDGTILLVDESQLQGFSRASDKIRYEPFGRFLSGLIGVLVLLVPMVFFFFDMRRAGHRNREQSH